MTPEWPDDTNWTETHRQFLAYLKRGYGFQEIVAERLRGFGLEVELPELRFGATVEESQQYSDEYDLLVEGKVVEVKSSSRAFTCVADWPFHVAMVDTVGKIERKRRKPVAYLLISQPTEAIVVVPGSTRDRWEKTRRFHQPSQVWEDYYVLSPSLLKPLEAFVAWLKNSPDAHYITDADLLAAFPGSTLEAA